MGIIESALKILDVLVRRSAVAGHEIKVHQLRAASGLSDIDFDSADTYLLESGYVDGTQGSPDGARWVTHSGVEFHHRKHKPPESSADIRLYERIAVFGFGVGFLFALIILAIKFPEPTPFQYTVFRIVLALAISGVAAFIPGSIEVNLNKWLRSGGAIAVFVITYFFSPANLVTESKPGHELRNPRSIVTIEFKNEKPFADRVVLGNASWRGYMFKVLLQNHTSSTLQVTHVKLVDLQQFDGKNFVDWEDSEQVYLSWDGTKSMAIPPQDKVLIPFARLYPPALQHEIDTLPSGSNDIPQFRFVVQSWPRRMPSHIPPGRHRFRIQVFFEKWPPAEVYLELDWPGKNRESADAMFREIKIRKL